METKITDLMGNKTLADRLQLPKVDYPLSDYNERSLIRNGSFSTAEARRMKACWGACSGISVGALETEVFKDLLEAAKAIIHRLDNGDTIGPGWYEAETLRDTVAKATA